MKSPDDNKAFHMCNMWTTYHIHSCSYIIPGKLLSRLSTSVNSKEAVRIQKLFKTSKFYQGTLTTKHVLHAYQDLGTTLQL